MQRAGTSSTHNYIEFLLQPPCILVEKAVSSISKYKSSGCILYDLRSSKKPPLLEAMNQIPTVAKYASIVQSLPSIIRKHLERTDEIEHHCKVRISKNDVQLIHDHQ